MNKELRIPLKLIESSLALKQTKLLRLFALAKLKGHRCDAKELISELKISPRTGRRLIKKLIDCGWVGADKKFLFPRSWKKLRLKKRSGLYLTKPPKDLKRFEAWCFAIALKKIYWKGSPHSKTGRVKQEDFPAQYLSKSLKLSESRFERLKARALRYKYISVTPQFTIIGKAREFESIRKHLHGHPVFKRGKHTVVPAISKIRILV